MIVRLKNSVERHIIMKLGLAQHRQAFVRACLCAAFLACLCLQPAAALADAPAVTPEQIEADWLRQDVLRAAPAPRPSYDTPRVIERGRKLAANLKALDASIASQEAALETAAERLAALPAGATKQAQRELYLAARDAKLAAAREARKAKRQSARAEPQRVPA